jgi:hypothetical protein
MEMPFQYLKNQGPFQSPELREDLRRRLNEVPGVTIDADAIELRPRIELATLAATPDAVERFTAVLEWMRRTFEGSPQQP